MFDSELDRDNSSVNLRRRAFLGVSVSVAGRRCLVVATQASADRGGDAEGRARRSHDCAILGFRPAYCKRSACREWSRATTSGASNSLPENSISRAVPIPKSLSAESIGTCMTRACTAASVVTTRCSVLQRNLILAPAGPVSGSRLRRRMCARSGIRVTASSGTRLRAPSATRISATSSMTARSRPDLRYCMNSASLKFVKQTRIDTSVTSCRRKLMNSPLPLISRAHRRRACLQPDFRLRGRAGMGFLVQLFAASSRTQEREGLLDAD